MNKRKSTFTAVFVDMAAARHRFLRCFEYAGCLVAVLLLLSSSLSLSGCLPNKKLTVASAATLVEGVAKSTYRQADLKLARDGIPAYLMLMDGMVEIVPDNDRLLIAASQAHSSFASVFAEDSDPEYAKTLYDKARCYALRSLEARGIAEPEHKPLDDFKDDVAKLGIKDVPCLFWTATAWGSWIKLNLDSMEALAQLPRVEILMKRALELDEGYYYGGPHIFMGIWFASWPKEAGGDLKKAQKHFQRAIELGRDKFLMTSVYYADLYGRKAPDKDLFVSTLQKVMDASVDRDPDITLINIVAKKRAAQLLKNVEEYFEEER